MIHTVTLALGTNVGDRFANIELALRFLETPLLVMDLGKDTEFAVIDTSFMYETAPMYVTDQPMFINCACLVETDLPPRILLTLLKKIEAKVGRVPSVRNGPRAIDLDILTYDSEVIDTRAEEHRYSLDNLDGELVIPHPRMTEREFVLKPMTDMIPEFVHPVINKDIRTLLKELTSTRLAGTTSMRKVIPFPRYPIPTSVTSDRSLHSFALPVPTTATYWKFLPSSPESFSTTSVQKKTYIMATLNATPDSFSDGSMHNSLQAAISYVTSSVAAGADIIDIGGYSTRPGAAYVSPQEEISRVVPIIEALRSLTTPKVKDVLISIDTFRADVAKAAVLAGANCINDVYAFTGPEYPLTNGSVDHLLSMRQVVRDLAVPIVLMHSRGDAGSNKDYSAYGPTVENAVLEGVRLELGYKVDTIVKGRNGIRRWFVIVDPGLGFSKTLEGNLSVLRNASSITAEIPLSSAGGRQNSLAGYPQLVGPSRKSFLGTILEHPASDGSYEGRATEPRERGWGTAAAVVCAVQQGALAVRVHDVLEMGDVVRVSSALWQNQGI